MAEFCKECSEKLFGEGFNDAKGLITEAEVKQGYGAQFLCESCGFCLVDHEGKVIKRLSDYAEG